MNWSKIEWNSLYNSLIAALTVSVGPNHCYKDHNYCVCITTSIVFVSPQVLCLYHHNYCVCINTSIVFVSTQEKWMKRKVLIETTNCSLLMLVDGVCIRKGHIRVLDVKTLVFLCRKSMPTV